MGKGFLVLEDGQVFEGKRFGAETDALGELVFTTGITGYVETLTDPSYAGQIVMQTYPLIGNYGVTQEDFEGGCFIHGYVVREWCDTPANFRMDCNIDTFLREQGVPGLCGIDTRQLTRILRNQGTMNAAICSEIPGDISAIRNYRIQNAVGRVTCKQSTVYSADGERKFKVALIDYGFKKSIVSELCRHGCEVTLFPATVSAEDVLAIKPDGIVLSNGPGDPAENTYAIEQIRKLLGRRPLFGICLGHQIAALATGSRTYKLKFGHRGMNHPVREVVPSSQPGKIVRTYITSQNHGYAVDSDSVKEGRISFINANDSTCEGIDYPAHDAFTVQFHPEAHPGPEDTRFLFTRFVSMMSSHAGTLGTV